MIHYNMYTILFYSIPHYTIYYTVYYTIYYTIYYTVLSSAIQYPCLD